MVSSYRHAYCWQAHAFTTDADQLVSNGGWRKGREAIVTGTLESSMPLSFVGRTPGPQADPLVGPYHPIQMQRQDEGVPAPQEFSVRGETE